MDMMAQIIKKTGGAILNIDYGAHAAYSDSIRAIKNHKYIPAPYFWQIPGKCDLSAHVNF
jgi:SAM-dependent MidA family methyltransferase